MKRPLLILTSLALVLLTLIFYQGQRRSYDIEERSFLMDTLVSIKVFYQDKETEDKLRQDLQVTLKEMREKSLLLDRYQPVNISRVSQINQAPAGQVFDLDPFLFSIFSQSQEIALQSKGAFDITVGAAVDLWTKAQDKNALFTEEERLRVLEQIDYSHIELTANGLSKKQDDTVIDLGGIAKGALAKGAAQSLRGAGINSAVLDAGGNIEVIGAKPGGQAFRIGIADPLSPQNTLGYMEVTDTAIVTAGIYQRFYQVGGVDYPHILDPQTGLPLANKLLSVTLVGPDGGLLDGLSTACMVLGPDQGLELISHYPQIQGLFISKDQDIYPSPGLDNFTLTQKDYHVQSKK